MGLLDSLKAAAGAVENAVAGGGGEQEKDVPPGEGAECDWYTMELGNNIGHWRGDRPAIKYQYDHDLKGLEIHYWWPGKSTKGECNDLTDKSRGCWFKGRLLNDPSCDDKNHCLHVAGHDGEPAHSYTCPNWITNPEGVPCKLPPGWQACPRHFHLVRVSSGVPQDFRNALAAPCGPMGEDNCLGNTQYETDVGMYFDLRMNAWYRCTPWMKCEKFDVKEISEEAGQKCGPKKTCTDEELCFNHAVSSKESTFHCFDKKKVFLVSSGDDMATEEMPLPLALIPPPPVIKSSAGEGKARRKEKQQSALLGKFL